MAEVSFYDSTGTKNTVVDGDTVWNPNKGLVRLGGFNTREVASLYDDKDKVKSRGYKRGEVGGDEAKQRLADLIKAGGFNIHDYVGTTKDEGKRDLSFLTNAKGERVEDYMIALGYAQPDEYTSKTSTDLKLDFELIESLKGRDALPYSEVGKPVDMYPYGLYPKQLAIDESTYDPDVHSGVMFRDPNRTMDNKAIGILGQAGVGWRTGAAGAKEGVWGYIDALGETFGSEMIESIGEAGVMRAREQIMNEPKIIINYKDVNGLMDSFSYIVNNAAMSAPYMLATLSAIAASVPATYFGGPVAGAAVGYIPISMIYAGHTWNEMEGQKGITQFAMASAAGVASSVLERIGLKGLMTPEGFLSEKGIKEASKLYAKKHGMSEEKATAIISKATRQEQSKFLKGMMALSPEMVKRFSAGRVAKQAMRGAARESFTEVGQEAIQAGTAGMFSEKDYQLDELLDRYINAGIAGGVLGGGISTAGGLYTAGQDRLKTSDLANWNRERILAIEQKRIRDQSTKGKIESVEERIDNVNNKDRYETGTTTTFQTRDGTTYRYQDNKSTRTDKKGESDLTDTVFIRPQDLKTVRENKNSPIRIEDNKIIFGSKDLYDTAEVEFSTTPVNTLVPIQYTDVINHIGEPIKFGSLKQDTTKRQPLRNVGRNAKRFSNIANEYESKYKGIPNFFKNNKDPYDYLESVAHGFMRMLIWGAEVNIANEEDLLNHPELLDLNARVGQTNTGVYHSGMNHRGYQDRLLERLKAMVDQKFIANIFKDETKRWYKLHPELDSENAVYVSKQLKAYGEADGFLLYEEFVSGELTLKEFKKELVAKGFDPEIELTNSKLEQINLAAMSIKQAYISAYLTINVEWTSEHPDQPLPTRPEDVPEEVANYWYVNEGLDWYKATQDPHGFKKFLIDEVGLNEKIANDYFETIAYRGTHKAKSTFSLVEGESYIPVSFRERVMGMSRLPGYKNWSSGNMFEALNKIQVEAAKYNSSMRYFGDGGRKLNEIFFDLERKVDEGLISRKAVEQAAWYVKAIIDSTHGNFRRIKDPRFAAINRLLTNWSIFAGLTLSTLSSIPETAMIWFNIKDDAEWQKANEALVKQTVALWSKTMQAEYDNAENNLKRSGVAYDANTVVDRLATGERDMAYVKAHESFFKAIGIKQFTQFQRRMNAAFGMDFIKSGFNILLTAPKNLSKLPDGTEATSTWDSFNFDKFTEYEMRTYNQLKDLGIDVELLMKYFYQLDEMKRDNVFNLSTQDRAFTTDFDEVEGIFMTPTRAFAEWMGPNATPQEEAFKDLARKQSGIPKRFKYKENEFLELEEEKQAFFKALDIMEEFEEQLENGIYKFVNERIQNPQAANRPLFFQDPHYQMMTQFNGFLSTFTANIVPKLWNRQLRKGNPKVKYDTFALIVTMIALGGASQYLKDLIKFFDLKGTPYLDSTGLAQRALYSSGVLGQVERVVDLASPLYPSRDDWIGSKLFGELGPSARNVANVLAGTQQIVTGEPEKGIRKALTAAPVVGTLPEVRGGLAQGITSPIDTSNLIMNWLLEESPPQRSK